LKKKYRLASVGMTAFLLARRKGKKTSRGDVYDQASWAAAVLRPYMIVLGASAVRERSTAIV
jgi:hypothetical protein